MFQFAYEYDDNAGDYRYTDWHSPQTNPNEYACQTPNELSEALLLYGCLLNKVQGRKEHAHFGYWKAWVESQVSHELEHSVAAMAANADAIIFGFRSLRHRFLKDGKIISLPAVQPFMRDIRVMPPLVVEDISTLAYPTELGFSDVEKIHIITDGGDANDAYTMIDAYNAHTGNNLLLPLYVTK